MKSDLSPDYGTGNPGGGPRNPWEANRRRPNGPFTANLIFGALAIFAGTVLLLDRLGLFDATIVFQLWPLVLIAVSLSLFARDFRRGSVPGVVLFVIGSVFLARNFGYTDLGLRDLWPVILIAVGVLILGNSIRARQQQNASLPASGHHPDFLNDWALFGGVQKIVQSQDFQGGELFAMFGGVEVNLRKARIRAGQPVIINANAIFGGIELSVPDDWHVVNEGVGVMGGYADSRRFIESSGEGNTSHQHVLIVRGMAVFGGVDIKN